MKVGARFMTVLLCSYVLVASSVFAQEHECGAGSLLNDPDKPFDFRGSLEIGFIDVISHTIQFGENGTEFDYIDEGGQDILFRFNRLTAELALGRRHTLILLFQPLNIQTEALLRRDVVIDDLIFPENTAVKLRYGFDFWRLSYLYDFWKQKDRELSIGLSLQIRNASISFRSYDGTLFRVNQGVGPVPIFKFRTRIPFSNGMWFGSEVDGFYASGRYITGSENDFVGSILDASLRLGFELNKSFDTFLNIRYIGGGARGTEEDDPGPGDGYTENWLHTVSVTLGTYIK
ncbi:hypothetical protein AMJ83_05185 [candidate division WOR_3 bacterium SM23_42]|uniref:Outer membrane protein beta-barrel domain-containing protein n=1 Tax=candidate division WOR_3 bacterium SM23_42 TaxID=1703779 RepID=A0A0S8FV96_UNCW3|nr:MAG: hypothetical protein AMJ83_05185 [candidate division WOR_3 bacterium SM23_42]